MVRPWGGSGGDCGFLFAHRQFNLQPFTREPLTWGKSCVNPAESFSSQRNLPAEISSLPNLKAHTRDYDLRGIRFQKTKETMGILDSIQRSPARRARLPRAIS